MSHWPSAKAKRVLSALFRLGWEIKRQSGSHRILSRLGFPDYVFAFHDGEEIGPNVSSHRKTYGAISSRLIAPIDPALI